MELTLPILPYETDALAPHISEDTVKTHYYKHHQGYLTKAIDLTKGTSLEKLSLEDIILKSRNNNQKLFNLTAQVWNHTLYWNSMSPNGGQKPAGALATQIEKDFGSFDQFIKEFKQCSVDKFGSGYAWLVFQNHRLEILRGDDAEIPVVELNQALLNIDVWEHAYYLDYKNERNRYVDIFFEKLVNWENASKRFKEVIKK